ncbi:ATP-dependent helicase [Ectothiorhodospiraceae bacterium BW-2]|nr:ATP-dependent helicase [Ectothiorhodospiraceae bacterium BW-2]
MQFTRQQAEVIHHGQGHAKVVAVAGSGKTATLLGHLCHTLKQGVSPHHILVVMFNVDARNAFLQRLQQRLGPMALLPDVRTFNSMGERLTRWLERSGSLPQRRLETDSYLLERIAREALIAHYGNKSSEVWDKEVMDAFLNYILLAKSTLKSAAKVCESYQFDEGFAVAFDHFESLRQQQQIRTYTDQIWEPVKLIMADEALQQQVANRMEVVLVDEFQDVNEIQIALIRLIVGQRARLVVVGDVDQCIYEWRGSRPRFLLREFQASYPDAKSYRLDTTFRYGHTLSLLANHAISHNQEREPTFSLSPPESRDITLQLHPQQGDSAALIEIVQRWSESRPLEQMAVLYRFGAMAVVDTLNLMAAGIPLRLRRIPSVFSFGVLNSLLAVLQLVTGRLLQKGQEEQLLQLLTQPAVTIDRRRLQHQINLACREGNFEQLWPLVDEVRHPFAREKFLQRLLWLQQQSRVVNGAEQSAATLLRHYLQQNDILAAMTKLATTATVAEERLTAVEQFIQFIAVRQLTVEAAVVLFQQLQQQLSQQSQGLLLTTIHQSKGLEWPCLVLPQLKQGVFPRAQCNIEEERRLWYVAITRCQEQLHLIAPHDPVLWQAFEQQQEVNSRDYIASRFIYESQPGLSVRVGEAIQRRQWQRLAEIGAVRGPEVVNHYLRQVVDDPKPPQLVRARGSR